VPPGSTTRQPRRSAAERVTVPSFRHTNADRYRNRVATAMSGGRLTPRVDARPTHKYDEHYGAEVAPSFIRDRSIDYALATPVPRVSRVSLYVCGPSLTVGQIHLKSHRPARTNR
jgi:hypothetical protein